ncbi:MAG: methyltransferase domain-containing protein [Myxococcota bacterium]
MSDPSPPLGYISPDHLEQIAQGVDHIKEHSRELMQLAPGHRVLDVGCGPGIDTLALAQEVGPTGEVLGIDYDAQMIARANQRAQEAGVQSWVCHLQLDATALPFDDNSFHSCRSDRVFQHLSDPERALDEMIRVTRPGGWIVLADPDQGTASIDTPHVEIERTLMRLRAEQMFNNGFAGRQHHGALVRRGLEEISMELYPLVNTDYGLLRQLDVIDRTEQHAMDTGVLNAEDIARWHQSLRQADEDGTFYGVVLLVLVAGRKA